MDRPTERHRGYSAPAQNTRLNKVKVAIIKAHDYDRAQIHAGVEKGIELIGGLEKIIKPRSNVFVKINHLSPASPAERGIVTHPVFVEAVLELLKSLMLTSRWAMTSILIPGMGFRSRVSARCAKGLDSG